ncbi:winged helix DNA-binding protein [Acidimangrovimonas pyrenivorans]|uniref:Winged helix DNA-binding protein n=1 Tax=Acidimangrovimonas pyrenivorans TaxID=2030798 RepID=A0ABV7ACN4_9RHOB
MPSTPKTPDTAIVSSAHLAEGGPGWQMSELEYALTMANNAFSRWMIHCMAALGHKDFNPLDILILHNVNHRTKEKRLIDIAFMLNIDDTHTVNYALKKLVKAGLVEGRKMGKEMFYQTTAEGADLCERYGKLRRACLLEAARAGGRDFDELSHVAAVLRSLSGLYDQASRAAASL